MTPILRNDSVVQSLWFLMPNAQVAELVDASASGADVRKGVEVRVFFWAPFAAKTEKSRPALVVELVDTLSSGGSAQWAWEFESPPRHQIAIKNRHILSVFLYLRCQSSPGTHN